MINKVIITGRLTSDVEVKKTTTNKSVCSINLAVNRKTKDENGQYLTDFIKVHCWEQRADFLGSYSHKGDLISVIGRLETESYTDKDSGKKISQTFIQAEEVEIVKSKEERKEAVQSIKPSDLELPWE